jgi:glycosyltransferase involved in cell wall biosynthesis
MEDPWLDVARAGDWLLSLERDLQPDLVHLNGFAHGSLKWMAPTVVVGHSCVLSWWNAVRHEPAPPEWNEYRRRVQDGLAHATAVVSVSRFMASQLKRYYGPLPPVVPIYNGRNTSDYHPALKEPFVLSCGRLWDEAKNMRALDEAAFLCRWPIYAAGEDCHPEGGKAALQGVQKIGSIGASDLRSWFARAAIYALPARYEPFGLSVLEAALSRCALVLGDSPSLREIWRDAAMFVPPEDHRALAAAINTLASDTDLRESLAGRARARALSLTPKRMVERYLSVYRVACATHSSMGARLSRAS